MGGEGKFSGVFSHQRFEAARGDDFPKRGVDGFGARADAEQFTGFVGQMHVETNRSKPSGHGVFPPYIYRIQ